MLTAAAGGLINPMVGALLHNGGAIFVVMNSARLLVEPSAEEQTGSEPSSGPSHETLQESLA
jgi:hypothetical protein